MKKKMLMDSKYTSLLKGLNEIQTTPTWAKKIGLFLRENVRVQKEVFEFRNNLFAKRGIDPKNGTLTPEQAKEIETEFAAHCAEDAVMTPLHLVFEDVDLRLTGSIYNDLMDLQDQVQGALSLVDKTPGPKDIAV